MNREPDIIGSKVITLDTVGSTNDYAMDLLRKGKVAEGTVVRAITQTAGRGQGENIWQSQAGKNLTFSVILFPRFLEASRQFLLNKAVSLGVIDYVGQKLAGTPVTLKWPNDIYAGTRKLGGILIMHSVKGSKIESSVAGIGLNINQQIFPQDVHNAVSFIDYFRKETHLETTLESLCLSIDKRYRQLKEHHSHVLDVAYRKVLLGFDIWQSYIARNEKIDGKILDVDEFGRLILETKNGKKRSFRHGEIVYLF